MKHKTDLSFDVIVIGGGHAGIEAAHAAAKLGSQTLLITLDLEKIGVMPCNPSVGGVGKGHIVFEISALGGLMPRLCTNSYLQARMLNTKKGPAVQGLRLQIDKHKYSLLSQQALKALPNLTLHAGIAEDLIIKNNAIAGVTTKNGTHFYAPNVIITTGTFLNGKIHIGDKQINAGREGEKCVSGLSKYLYSCGLKMGRLKTGTPPRIVKDSIDFSKLEKQDADTLNYLYEFKPHTSITTRDCYIAYTNQNTHDIILKNMHLSAIGGGHSTGTAPRYCPSIEDKVKRFPDKDAHHVFVEPDDTENKEMYPSGISTSLPIEIQEQYIRSMVGFENAIIARPGYAVEYDFVLPNQLHHTLEVKILPGLFLAGQINGTTGYEEAAGQGLIAGINAHQKAQTKEAFILDRTESYIGVMIDDLVTMSVDEPYRMFTSRAERRLVLRQDNVFMRLTPKGYAVGLVDKQMYEDACAEKDLVEQTLATIKKSYKQTEALHTFGHEQAASITELQKQFGPLPDRAANIIHAQIRYGPYMEREQREIEKRAQYKNLPFPVTFNFDGLPGLSTELQQKLHKHKPASIADASLIPGMTPAALSLLIFRIRDHLKTT